MASKEVRQTIASWMELKGVVNTIVAVATAKALVSKREFDHLMVIDIGNTCLPADGIRQKELLLLGNFKYQEQEWKQGYRFTSKSLT